SIPSEDPYEEAAQQLFEQVPHPLEYVPRDHVPVFVLEFEHHEDLVPAEGEAPTSLLPPGPLLATPRPGCEVGESSAAAARRQGHAMAHGVDCSYIETRLQDTERRMMAALELVNRRSIRGTSCSVGDSWRRLEWQRQAADDFAVEHIMLPRLWS
nr:hypothetical protein [Tanacetum cinerariifolium]